MNMASFVALTLTCSHTGITNTQKQTYKAFLFLPSSVYQIRFCPSFPFHTFTKFQRLIVFTLAVRQKEVKCEMYRERWVLLASVFITDGHLC